MKTLIILAALVFSLVNAQWHFEEEVDAFTDAANQYAYVAQGEPYDLQTLSFGCVNDAKAAIFSPNDYVGGERVEVLMRFDKGEPLNRYWQVSENGLDLILLNARAERLYQNMLGSQTLAMRFQSVGGSVQTYQFDVSGFNEVGGGLTCFGSGAEAFGGD